MYTIRETVEDFQILYNGHTIAVCYDRYIAETIKLALNNYLEDLKALQEQELEPHDS